MVEGWGRLVGPFAGGWWEGVLGRAEGSWALRGEVSAPFAAGVRPAQWNVRPSRARLPLRLKFRIAK